MSDEIKEKLSSRKWQLTIALNAIAAVGLFTGHLSGGEWTTIATVSLGAYNLANVLDPDKRK